jgi:hypothetical protein
MMLIGDRLGLTKTGQGARVEAFFRSTPGLIVPGKGFLMYKWLLFLTNNLVGGSEDVLIDLGVREALKLQKIADKTKAAKSNL